MRMLVPGSITGGGDARENLRKPRDGGGRPDAGGGRGMEKVGKMVNFVVARSAGDNRCRTGHGDEGGSGQKGEHGPTGNWEKGGRAERCFIEEKKLGGGGGRSARKGEHGPTRNVGMGRKEVELDGAL